jgi:hypothetical protein
MYVCIFIVDKSPDGELPLEFDDKQQATTFVERLRWLMRAKRVFLRSRNLPAMDDDDELLKFINEVCVKLWGFGTVVDF